MGLIVFLLVRVAPVLLGVTNKVMMDWALHLIITMSLVVAVVVGTCSQEQLIVP
tara:strand:- start:526 stop:687 length:162 start_codon:yes stop_codon:yes gene_type:complete